MIWEVFEIKKKKQQQQIFCTKRLGKEMLCEVMTVKDAHFSFTSTANLEILNIIAHPFIRKLYGLDYQRGQIAAEIHPRKMQATTRKCWPHLWKNGQN